MQQSVSKWKSNKLAIKPQHFTMFWSTKYNKLKAKLLANILWCFTLTLSLFSVRRSWVSSLSASTAKHSKQSTFFSALTKADKEKYSPDQQNLFKTLFTYINVFSQLMSQRFPWVYCTSSMLNCFCILKIEFLAFHNYRNKTKLNVIRPSYLSSFHKSHILVPQFLIFTNLFLQLYAETFISKLQTENTLKNSKLSPPIVSVLHK